MDSITKAQDQLGKRKRAIKEQKPKKTKKNPQKGSKRSAEANTDMKKGTKEGETTPSSPVVTTRSKTNKARNDKEQTSRKKSQKKKPSKENRKQQKEKK